MFISSCSCGRLKEGPPPPPPLIWSGHSTSLFSPFPPDYAKYVITVNTLIPPSTFSLIYPYGVFLARAIRRLKCLPKKKEEWWAPPHTRTHTQNSLSISQDNLSDFPVYKKGIPFSLLRFNGCWETLLSPSSRPKWLFLTRLISASDSTKEGQSSSSSSSSSSSFPPS